MKSAGIQIPNDPAKQWVLDSLGHGGPLSQQISTSGGRDRGYGHPARERGDPEPGERRSFQTGHRLSHSQRDRLTAMFFARFARTATMTLVVEDDLQRRGDPHVEERAAFVGDRVVHWTVVTDGDQDDVVETLRSGASGYPLNAFVCEGTPSSFGLEAGAELDSDALDKLREAVKLVIVGAYDAETHLCWKPEATEQGLA